MKIIGSPGFYIQQPPEANKFSGFELSQGLYLTKMWSSLENVVKVGI